MSRILIAVPTFENIYPDTFKSIYRLEKGDNEVDFDYIRGYDVAKARNLIALETLHCGYDYVLTIDSDVEVPWDALLNLLQTEQACKLGHTMAVGYCPSRPKNGENRNNRTTAYKFGGRDYIHENAYTGDELLTMLRKDGVTSVQVRGTGLACALIHRSVFEKLKYPFFKWTEYSEGHNLSEDLYFCEQMAKVQKPIYLDTRVSCGHVMRYISKI